MGTKKKSGAGRQRDAAKAVVAVAVLPGMPPADPPKPTATVSGVSFASIKVSDLVASKDPDNPRRISQHDYEALRKSLERFGVVEPIVFNTRTGRVVGGHQRIDAAESLGIKEMPACLIDVSESEERALNVALNRISGDWEWRKLQEYLQEIVDFPELQPLTGFTADEYKGILDGSAFPKEYLKEAGLRGMGAEPGDGVDRGAGENPEIRDPGAIAPDETKDPVAKRGELWKLGEHRIMCGDSTSAEDMARLMGGEQASLLATDPPYLVDYQGGNHPESWANKPDVKDKHWDDYVDPKSGLAFFTDWLRTALPHCRSDVPVYQWHATRRQVMIEQAWEANNLLVHQTIIWVKARPVLTRRHFMWQHEPCFYGWPQGNQPDGNRKPDSNARTVWQIDQQGEQDGIHPTQKPVEIFLRPIGWHTRPGEIVLEPFSGSGTQLIAAERLRRRCFAMEISPAFVDAAIQRWETATGQKAELLGVDATDGGAGQQESKPARKPAKKKKANATKAKAKNNKGG